MALPGTFQDYTRYTDRKTAYIEDLRVDEHKPSPLAIIYRSEMDYISRCILDYPNIETGGQLFGFWTGNGIPVVLYAIGPGPHANHEKTFFNQDIDYLTQIGRLLTDKFELQHIGEWHSHHRLGLAHPSGHDANTMITCIDKLGLRRFLLCIGNTDGHSTTLNAFNFHEEDLGNYVHAAWILKDMESPFRPIVDRELSQLLRHPYREYGRLGTNYMAVNRPVQQKASFSGDYWLSNKANNAELKKIMDLYTTLFGCVPQLSVDDQGYVTLNASTIAGQAAVYFPKGFPIEKPKLHFPSALRPQPQEIVITLPDGSTMREKTDIQIPEWEFNGNIYESFSTYVLRLLGKMPPKMTLEYSEDEIYSPANTDTGEIDKVESAESPAEEMALEDSKAAEEMSKLDSDSFEEMAKMDSEYAEKSDSALLSEDQEIPTDENKPENITSDEENKQ